MKLRVKLFDLVMAFSNALDQIHPELANHHKRVGLLIDLLGERLGLSEARQLSLFLAAVLHDVGALPLRISTTELIFEQDRYRHARAGWLLLKECAPLARTAELVLHHHIHWEQAKNCELVVRGGCLINFADRVDVLLRQSPDFNEALVNARNTLRQMKGSLYAPHHVQAMEEALLIPRHVEWLQAIHQGFPPYLREKYGNDWLNTEQIMQFCMFFAHVIDAFSPFTVTHSSGVAWTARELGRLAGMGSELDILFVAGMMHDIGKLGVPLNLLEKPAALSREEFCRMKRHAALSLSWLEAVPGFEQAGRWGALHHERLDGSGYPYGLKGDMVPLPSRVIAVADIFTALTEDRPYRAGMDPAEAVNILKDMSAKGQLDAELVHLMATHVEAINGIREAVQSQNRRKFNELHKACTEDAARGNLP